MCMTLSLAELRTSWSVWPPSSASAVKMETSRRRISSVVMGLCVVARVQRRREVDPDIPQTIGRDFCLADQ